MVAYSFKPSFVHPIQLGIKRQTIRLPRKRHARPGEPVQLYTGMRTRACRKLVDPDPICAGVSLVDLDVGLVDAEAIGIAVNGVRLGFKEAIDFAEADGFATDHWDLCSCPLELMNRWWRMTHGPGRFSGVLITWAPAAGGGFARSADGQQT